MLQETKNTMVENENSNHAISHSFPSSYYPIFPSFQKPMKFPDTKRLAEKGGHRDAHVRHHHGPEFGPRSLPGLGKLTSK